MIGKTVKLKIPCLGNQAGAIGVCYEDYIIGDTPGSSFIFENGNYDGFSDEEQALFLEPVGTCRTLSGYRFTNVMRLSQDFDRGIFKLAFGKE